MEGRLDLIDGGWRIVVNLRPGRNSVFPAGVNTDHVPDPQRQRLAPGVDQTDALAGAEH
jgi:hypothetical protein